MDDKKRVALVETKTIDLAAAQGSLPSSTTRYQLDNHLGTACLELDETAAVITYEEYYPYGSTSYQSGHTLAEVSLKRYRYTGKERDEETGLYYHGVRYCAPWLVRWISCDPIGIGDGLNLYNYVGNKPTSLVDPKRTDGKKPDDAPVKQDGPPEGYTDVTVTDENGNVVATARNPNEDDTGPDPTLPSLTATQGAAGISGQPDKALGGFQAVESFGNLRGHRGRNAKRVFVRTSFAFWVSALS